MGQFKRAMKELSLAGYFVKDGEYKGLIGLAVKGLMTSLLRRNHSEKSARLSAMVFIQLVNQEVLTPLTGADDEWEELAKGTIPGEDRHWQNKRHLDIFKNSKGRVTNINSRIFVNADGTPFWDKASCEVITLPCIPATVFIHEGSPEAEPYKHVFTKKTVN